MLLATALVSATFLATGLIDIRGAGQCPSADDVRLYLQPLLPGDTTRASAAVDVATVAVLTQGPDETTLQVQLVREDGSLVGQRRLVLRTSCQELAATAATLLAAWETEPTVSGSLPVERREPRPADPAAQTIEMLIAAGAGGTLVGGTAAQPVPAPRADVATFGSSAGRISASSTAAQNPTSLLGEAMRLLRRGHSPEGALTLLNDNAAILNASLVAHEATVIRVEALLALRRASEALRLLDEMPLADVAASHALLIARGKLRSGAKRCAEAVADFDRVLSEVPTTDRQALFGRALCRQSLGDRAGARADLQRYRRQFANDSAIEELERRLAEP